MPTRIRRLSQPDDEPWCGQVCVAMLAGISIEKSLEIFGTRGKTCGDCVAGALRHLGFQCTGKLFRYYGGPLPKTCIVRWTYDVKPKRSHWMLYLGGMRYDPGSSDLVSNLYPGKITSYLAVYV